VIVYSIIESAAHPQLGELYRRLGYEEIRLASVRKAIQQLKSQPPDLVVADFLYGYGNNYAGVNISNLDVFLYSLQKYAPDCKVIVFYEKTEQAYISKLHELFNILASLAYPVRESDLEALLLRGY
jgi:DNA-binding NarL/FixJ family response regulator